MIKTKLQQQTSSFSDSGFTIVESLMGASVLAIVLFATLPVLSLSTALRVQSKRTELAAEAANIFINSVRNNSITSPTRVITLTLTNTTTNRRIEDNLIDTREMPVPTTTDTDLYLFNKSGTITPNCSLASSLAICKPDNSNPFDEFYIQAAQVKVAGSKVTDGYLLAIRIYREDVDVAQTILASSSASSRSGILADKQAPILQTTVEISGSTTTFQTLCSRVGLLNNQPCQ
jgi:type II secretory pathway pseudopilin PulG